MARPGKAGWAKQSDYGNHVWKATEQFGESLCKARFLQDGVLHIPTRRMFNGQGKKRNEEVEVVAMMVVGGRADAPAWGRSPGRNVRAASRSIDSPAMESRSPNRINDL